MASMYVPFFLVLYVSIVSESAFVDTLSKCKIKDMMCQRELIQKVLKGLSKNGATEIGIPPIDPITLKDVSVNVLDTLELSLIEGYAKGVKDCVIDKFEHSVDDEQAFMDMTCNITVKGKYKTFVTSPLIKELLNGNSPVYGEGNGKVKIENLKLKFYFFYFIQKRNGEIYIKCKADKTKYTYDIQGNMAFFADNLYLGNVESSKLVTGILNENWKALVVPFTKPFVDKGLEYGLGYLHAFFDNVPLKHYISDDLSAYARMNVK